MRIGKVQLKNSDHYMFVYAETKVLEVLNWAKDIVGRDVSFNDLKYTPCSGRSIFCDVRESVTTNDKEELTIELIRTEIFIKDIVEVRPCFFNLSNPLESILILKNRRAYQVHESAESLNERIKNA
jgi:hypothetical protein